MLSHLFGTHLTRAEISSLDQVAGDSHVAGKINVGQWLSRTTKAYRGVGNGSVDIVTRLRTRL
jgi:hypothetical protein